MDGWIKLHRKLLKSACASDPEYLAVWIHILLMASHEEKQIIFNGKKMALKSGSFVTSRLKMATQSGVHRSKVDRILNYLKIEHQIEQVSLGTGRLISIVNWHLYQSREQVSEQPESSQRAASEQPVSTIKNVRTQEVKKEKLVSICKTDHHFSDDSLFLFEVFFEATRSIPSMQGWSRQKCMEIHQAMADWSASRSVNKRADWLAVARTFSIKQDSNSIGNPKNGRAPRHVESGKSKLHSDDRVCLCCQVPWVEDGLGGLKPKCKCHNPFVWCEEHLKCENCCGCQTKKHQNLSQRASLKSQTGGV
jgi:DNA-binding transcriptional regulator YhcF (GntR family)